MPATFRAGETTVNNGGTVTKTTDVPTGTVDEDILIFLSYMHDSSATVIEWPAGVTELDQDTVSSTDFTGGSAYRVADSEPADYTVENGNGNSGTDQFFAIAAVQDADTGSPIADSAIVFYDEGQGTPDVHAPSVNGVTGGLLICAWFQRYDTPGVGSITPPGGMTLGGQGQTSLSSDGYSMAAWAWEELDADGATGLRTGTTSKVLGDYNQFGVSIVIAPAGAVLPTADAGPNQTVAAGQQDVQLAGTPSGGAGAPYTYTWRIITDTTGGAVLSSTSVEDPTLDVGGAGGSVVLGFKVADDDDVESAEDTVTITAIGAGGVAVPVADVTITGWTGVPSGTPLYPKLADTTDATYAVYVDPEDAVVGEWRLSEWTPTPGLGAKLTIRPSMIGTSASIDVQLREGASTVIASWNDQEWTAATLVQGIELTVTSTQVASIVDFDDLRVRITGEVTV